MEYMFSGCVRVSVSKKMASRLLSLSVQIVVGAPILCRLPSSTRKCRQLLDCPPDFQPRSDMANTLERRRHRNSAITFAKVSAWLSCTVKDVSP